MAMGEPDLSETMLQQNTAANAGHYSKPSSVDAALAVLGDGDAWRIVAGGTDHFPARVGPTAPESVMDVSGIEALKGIKVQGHGQVIRIGALARWSDVLKADLPDAFDGLKLAARQVGGVQIQNRGTVAGNICNASPAADGVPPLLALDARVVLAGPDGERSLPIQDFITGYRTTARAPNELVVAIDVPTPNAAARSAFLKLGARHYLVISIAMVAGVLTPAPDGRVASVSIAVGACSAVAQRLTALEDALQGRHLDTQLSQVLSPDHFADLSPIDDPRANAEYRREAARILVARLLDQMQDQMRGVV